MELITSLLLLLVASRLFGRLFQALGYFAVIGEILAGFLLGPGVFGFIEPSTALHGIVELGIFLLIFAAGLEVDLKDFITSLKNKALICGLFGFVGAFSAGLLFGFLFKLPFLSSVTLGLCFSITSIPVALKFIGGFKLGGTLAGTTIMGAAVVIEIISLLVLGISSGAKEEYRLLEYLKMIFFKGFLMFLFFFLVMTINKFLRSEFRYIRRTQKLFRHLIGDLGEEAVLGLGVLFVLSFSAASEALGFHFIIGAFFGGLLLNKDIIGTDFFDSLSRSLESITSHFLTPVFFAYLGLLMKWDSMIGSGYFVAALIAAGYGSKIFSSWLGAKLSGFSGKEALKIGLVLNSRGTFDLIVADIARDRGYIDSKIFSILIVFGVLSVILNPLLYRRLFSASDEGEVTAKKSAPRPKLTDPGI